jgi:poly(A) polymerase
MLRAEVGEVDQELADFWTDVQRQNKQQRAESFDVRPQGKARKCRRRPRRRPTPAKS